MSNRFQPKWKELANVEVIPSEEYWNRRRDVKFFGAVHRDIPAFVTTTRNKKTGVCSFVDDTCSLTKKTKNDITQFFSNESNRKKSCVYLVVDRSKLPSNYK